MHTKTRRLDQRISVSRAWANEVQRRSQRCSLLNLLVADMLPLLPEPDRSKFEVRWRGIDTTRASLYDSHKVNNTTNETTPTQSQAISSDPQVSGEGVMRDEEE